MKKLKTITTVIICIIIVFTSSAVSYAANAESENYKILIEHGFTEDYINSLTDTMIDKMAETIKKESDPEYVTDYDWLVSLDLPEDFINSLSESSLKKIRVALGDSKLSSIDYNTGSEANNSDVIVKKLSVQLTDKKDGSVASETVCIYWEWRINKPLVREEDYIEANWNKDIFCYNADSFYAEDYKRNNTGDKWTVSENYTELSRVSLNNLGHWAKIYGSKKQVGGFMIFSLLPTHPIDTKTDYDRDVDIIYTHETKTTLTIALCIIFILLVLSTIWIITEIRKRRK